MSADQKKFYLTTPIYYVNARPHIGHAYTTIVADVLARRHRLLGDDTFFLTGTDEHGQKIERSAAAAGIAPQQFADQVSIQFRNLWNRMGLTYDRYIRTTDEKHKRGVQKLFADLYERGFIYLDSYTGQYSVGEEMFVEGPPGTIGPDGKVTETVTEENFFFKLSEFQVALIDRIESNELAITPDSSRNEVLGFLRGNVNEPGVTTKLSAAGTPYVPGALRDLSVSRSSFTWGIPVPEPAASASVQKHVIYVWLDALTNYMTAVGYGSDDPKDEAEFARYWPADLHLVGKEITRFHCVYWPAFLLAANLPLPKAITANGWLLFDNAKMSKSRGNVVRTETILDGFGDHVYGKQFPDSTKQERDLFAADVLRYFLLREIPFGQDGSFSFDAMITRYNADLANGYGNLVSRTLAMIQKYFDGVIPIGRMNEGVGFEIGLRASAIANNFAEFDFASLLENIAGIVRSADAHITSTAPWKVASDPSRTEELKNILYTAAESVRLVTGLIEPILPLAAAQVFSQLGIPTSRKPGDEPKWTSKTLGQLAPIFPRADKGLVQIMTDMENPTPAEPVTADSTHPAAAPRTSSLGEPTGTLPVGGSASTSTHDGPPPSHTEATASGSFASVASQTPITASPTDASPAITIDDFAKVELRVAQIIVAERIPKADKLLRLEVDLGHEKRQILSGIAEWYTPEDLIGRRIVVITNLAPRKMRGLESHGMLLAASEGDGGKPVLATFGEEIALGSRLK